VAQNRSMGRSLTNSRGLTTDMTSCIASVCFLSDKPEHADARSPTVLTLIADCVTTGRSFSKKRDVSNDGDMYFASALVHAEVNRGSQMMFTVSPIVKNMLRLCVAQLIK
jgi:hypothetical protein